MTDQELTDELGVTLEVVRLLKPADRARYEHLVGVAREVQLWEAGVGPRPTGVIMCGSKQVRGGRP